MVSVTVVRPAPRLDDDAELARFLDSRPRFSEHKWIDLSQGPQGETIGFLQRDDDLDGQLVGYAHASAHGDAPGPAFDEGERELCPDDACIGLIGEDGRCRECGRSRQS